MLRCQYEHGEVVFESMLSERRKIEYLFYGSCEMVVCKKLTYFTFLWVHENKICMVFLAMLIGSFLEEMC